MRHAERKGVFPTARAIGSQFAGAFRWRTDFGGRAWDMSGVHLGYMRKPVDANTLEDTSRGLADSEASKDAV